jgi:hypothetical protein
MRRAPSVLPRKAGRSTRPIRSPRTALHAAASPHHHVASDGSASSSPSSDEAIAGRKPCTALDSRKPLPSALASTRFCARSTCTRPGTPRPNQSQLERIAVIVVEAPQRDAPGARRCAGRGARRAPSGQPFDQGQAEVTQGRRAQPGRCRGGISSATRICRLGRARRRACCCGVEQAPVARRDVLRSSRRL